MRTEKNGLRVCGRGGDGVRSAMAGGFATFLVGVWIRTLGVVC
jgi:hypothetical protein